jgi:hypothetical protein
MQKMKEKEEQSLVGRADNISEKYGPRTSSYLFIFSEKTWSTLSFITIMFYFIVLSTNSFENNIDGHMEKSI